MRTCTQCKRELSDDSFAWRSKAKGRRQSWCRDCHREHYQKDRVARRDHYLESRARSKAERIAETNEYLRGYLSEHPCVDCGEDDLLVLEFDHCRGEKKGDVSNLRLRGCSVARVKQEIELCEVVCANCHRRRTLGRLDSHWRQE